MKKVIVSMMVSVDGFIAGPQGELDWHVWGDDMDTYANDLIDAAGTLLLGRVAYPTYADFWPGAEANPLSPKGVKEFAHKMNELPKVVFSTTLKNAAWKNTRVADNIPREVERLKAQPGKDLVLLAGGSLVSSFASLGLVDEYRLIVNPVMIGKGKPLFTGIQSMRNLQLKKATPMRSGHVIQYYAT